MHDLLKKKSLWPTLGIFIITSIALGYHIGKYTEKEDVSKKFNNIKQIRLPNEEYPLVSKLIGSEIPNAIEFGIYVDLYDKIKKFIDIQIKTTPLTKFSFYFRDLNTGLWFGINENDEYIPASLFKLPIAITYYKESITDRTILDKTYMYTAELDSKLDTQIGLEKSALVVGNYYTVEELIEKMLINSDNGAKNLLTENIDITALNTLFNLVQLSEPAQNNYYISPKEYAFFLRILYNGSYLGQERSQNILTILSKTNFGSGIRKAVPNDITVVHKFGSLNFMDKDTKQKTIGFNDCGIIYYPKKPFILCFMSTGTEQQALVNNIEKVTSFMLEYIQNN
mgnify:CR=1 FL=1